MSRLVRPETCKNCASAELETGNQMFCHANPPITHPTIVPDNVAPGYKIRMITAWPMVTADEWCKQHKPRIALASNLTEANKPDPLLAPGAGSGARMMVGGRDGPK